MLLTALAPAVWGSTYLVTTELLPPGRPLLASAVRALPAGLVLLAIGRRLPHGAWWWRAAVLGALNIGVFFYLLFVAAYHLPGGVAALVVAVQPMIVLLLGAVLLKEPIRPAQVTACVLGVAGVALLALTPRADIDATGIVAGLAAAVSMAVGIVLTKLWGRPAGIGVLTFTGWQLTAGGLLLAPVTLAAEGLPTRVTAGNIAGFAYLCLIGALLAYAVWFRGIARLPALAVSILGFASPLTATALGYLVLGQGLTPLQLAGSAAVVASVALAQTSQPPRAGTPADGTSSTPTHDHAPAAKGKP
ncbi:DMT family transporter [Streptomyces sp. NBC_00081]|nr:EamA family transporter [Streptomyces sp. NBC_00569]WSE13508.1 DMT family transporter [Streptomyces sp. NBC_01397]WUB97574.1 DMT family transporter [Streptomyces sp. NBC_00569]